jgi:glyoxylase-like metal-dependent hydrolase (beta-lactamase superfamily II)
VSVWHELGEGCFRRRYERYDVNVGVVRGSEGLVLFDTRGSPVQGAELRAELAELGRHRVRHVVNSHWHFDHVLGNQCFAYGATPPAVWGHPGLNDMFERYGTTLLPRACAYDPELESELDDLRPVLPDHHVIARATIDLGDRTVELAYHGRGHTGHDIVAIVPDVRVVFAGDLLEESAPPAYGDDCFPISWPQTVASVLADAPVDSTIVPGHGDVMRLDEARAQADALAAVADSLRALQRAGIAPARALDAATGEWPFPVDLLDDAVVRGYAELQGNVD